MARMDYAGSDTATLGITDFYGLNNAVQFSQINIKQSPSLENLIPYRVGGIRNRSGTVPLTVTPRAGGLAKLFPYRSGGVDKLVATGGTTLYKYNSTTFAWDAQTMTNVLITDKIGAVQYRNESGSEVLVIADGGPLKFYNGTAVANITPAADDTSPLPANDMANINSTQPPIGVTVHNNRLVTWSANTDTIHQSKPGFYDYFPQTSYQRFVNENDYVQTCISFGSSLLVFMRRCVGVLFGDGYSATPQATDWSQDFLDTSEGCVNPRSVRVVVFPDAHEEVFYQTADGVSAVVNVDTKSLDNSTRIATSSRTENLINWRLLGITEAEWNNAISYSTEGKYWLIFRDGADYRGLVFDTNNFQWYPIRNVKATDLYADETRFYFIGTDGHLKVFDDTLYKDYNDAAKTSGDNVAWFWHSSLLSPQTTGFDHLWDILMIECQQFMKTSRIKVEVNTNRRSNLTFNLDTVLQSEVMIVGQSIIGEGVIANLALTDLITVAQRLRCFIKGQYLQIKLSNANGEPVELYKVLVELRPQLTYQ